MFDLQTLNRLNAEQEARELKLRQKYAPKVRLPHEQALSEAPVCCLGLPQAPEVSVQ